MELLESFIEKAKENKRRIVLPESKDPRIVSATSSIILKGIADIVLVGDEEELRAQFDNETVRENVIIYDPEKNKELLEELAIILFERRKHRGLTIEEARGIVLKKPHFYGALLVEKGLADGMVCGAVCTTGVTLQAILHCVGTKEGSSLLSSFFMMKTDNKLMGNNGLMFFADCAVNPNPNDEQLASIAIDTAKSYKCIINDEPKVSMLSFSTLGSAKHELVEKVRSAIEIARKKDADLQIDGEFQFDTAIIPSVARRKAPESNIAGKGNCLIFPDLQSGNIGYKIAERMGNAIAIGPIIQGTKKPINDLSRGCSVEDIIYVTAITAVQAGDAC